MTERKCHNMPTVPVDTSKKLDWKTSMVRCQGPSSSSKLCIFEYDMCTAIMYSPYHSFKNTCVYLHINNLQCISLLEIYYRYLTLDIFKSCQSFYAMRTTTIQLPAEVATNWEVNSCMAHATFILKRFGVNNQLNNKKQQRQQQLVKHWVYPLSLESEKLCFTWS